MPLRGFLSQERVREDQRSEAPATLLPSPSSPVQSLKAAVVPPRLDPPWGFAAPSLLGADSCRLPASPQ